MNAMEPEARNFLMAAEMRAVTAAKHGDPLAYLFLSDFYAEFQAAMRYPDVAADSDDLKRLEEENMKKSEHYRCLLARHPDEEMGQLFCVKSGLLRRS